MTSPDREPSVERSLADAVALLGAIPELAASPKAAAALDLLAERHDARALVKFQRLARAAELVGSSLDLGAVLCRALDAAVDVMHAERGFLVLDEGRQIAATHNLDLSRLEDAASAREVVDRVLANGEPLFQTDAQSGAQRNVQPSIVALHARSIACVPLRVRERTIGAVYLDSRIIPGLFQPGDREMLIAFAHQAALAIENARLFKEERGRRTAVAALQAFQTRILEAIASGVITLSAQGDITSFNRAAEKTFGIAAEAMVGKAASTIGGPIKEFPELLQIFFASGAVQLRAEVAAERSDGEQLILEIQLSPLDGPDGKGVAMVVTDTTKQRNFEEAHALAMARAGRVQDSFSRYLAPHVVQSLIRDPSAVRLGGERGRATMLFADIRGFTSLAARLPAERVVEILNTYFEEAVRIVFEHGGLLDKFYGDGVMAVFGPPLVRADDAARALAAAIDLQEAVAKLDLRFDHPLQISVGLATGNVVAGHIGSTKRMDYTVIGDAVNLASGLQSAAPAGAIYLDEATYHSAGNIALPMHHMATRIKGRSDLVPAFAVFPLER